MFLTVIGGDVETRVGGIARHQAEDKKARSALTLAERKHKSEDAKATKLAEKAVLAAQKSVEAEEAKQAAMAAVSPLAAAKNAADADAAAKGAAAEAIRVLNGAAKAGVTVEEFVTAESEKAWQVAAERQAKQASADRLRVRWPRPRAVAGHAHALGGAFIRTRRWMRSITDCGPQ
jgi:hypothetical protein